MTDHPSFTPPLDRDALREQYARIIAPATWAEYDRRVAFLSTVPMEPDVRARSIEHEQGFCKQSLMKADALLALNPPDVKGREVLEQRIADLRTANDVFAEMDRDTSRDRERNEREIEWLTRVIAPMFDNDLSPSDPVLGEKWQAEAEKHLGASATPALSVSVRSVQSTTEQSEKTPRSPSHGEG